MLQKYRQPRRTDTEWMERKRLIFRYTANIGSTEPILAYR